jgi:hypothetical protein
MTDEEKKLLLFNWPADGVGVWVLRFASAEALPRDFGRISLEMNMEERIQIIRKYGTTFVEDVMQVEELYEAFWFCDRFQYTTRSFLVIQDSHDYIFPILP